MACAFRGGKSKYHPIDASSWGYCPDILISKPEECSENYDRVEDICVRISPYKLKWEDAEAKCQTEGSHLINIMSEAVQIGVIKLLKKKEAVKSFFELNNWSTQDLEGYWTGGMVSTCVVLLLTETMVLDKQ